MDDPLQRLVLRRLRVVASALASCLGSLTRTRKAERASGKRRPSIRSWDSSIFSTGNAYPDFNEGETRSRDSQGMY